MTVRADCAVSACSPLPLPVKALAPRLSGWAWGVGRPLDRSPLPPYQVAGLWNKANFPFHQPCLFIGFRAASSHNPTSVSFLASNVRLLRSRDIWLPGFSRSRAAHENSQGWLWGAAAPGSLSPGGGSGGTFLAAAKTICLGDPPCFSPAGHWLPTYAYSSVEQKYASGRADELQDQVSPPVFPGPTSLLSTKCYLGILPVGSDVCLTLRTVCEHWVSFGHSVSWFRRVPYIEGHFCWGSVCLGLHINNHKINSFMHFKQSLFHQ